MYECCLGCFVTRELAGLQRQAEQVRWIVGARVFNQPSLSLNSAIKPLHIEYGLLELGTLWFFSAVF